MNLTYYYLWTFTIIGKLILLVKDKDCQKNISNKIEE